ncbi:19631_t:CDS:2 [Racocetra persica]|uniref:19631_t:CDS:1 n=1 Tax=Racocetra persica TaxID=160502 RepID=A0ACA9KHB8_9GLOM|nr:19631_t:CDS:2 [Racocetra persica]
MKGFSELSSGNTILFYLCFVVIFHIIGAVVIGDTKYLHHWYSL